MAFTQAQKRFIEEYLTDRDPYEAARRAGVAKVALKSTVKRWMADEDLRAEIDKRTAAMDPLDMIKPQWVIAKFQEIASCRFSSASAKNAALRELATLAKMYPEKSKDDEDDKKRRSTVLMVPGDASVESWEEAAMKQQRALKDDVRN